MVASKPVWDLPPKALILPCDEIHVWRASQTLMAGSLESLQQILSADELKRAERFYFQKDREHFVVARGLLRVLLGCYLNREPRQLRFCYGPHGKPALARESGGDELRFNLSHSRGLVLYAVSKAHEIGVDLERIRLEMSVQQIAERFFSSRELSVLRSLPEDMQQSAFFTCWTRKEAYLKARGEGLAIPLDQFDVSLAPREPPALLGSKWDSQEISGWSLHDLNPGLGYAAALAVKGQQWRIKCWRWTERI